MKSCLMAHWKQLMKKTKFWLHSCATWSHLHLAISDALDFSSKIVFTYYKFSKTKQNYIKPQDLHVILKKMPWKVTSRSNVPTQQKQHEKYFICQVPLLPWSTFKGQKVYLKVYRFPSQNIYYYKVLWDPLCELDYFKLSQV